ncbi:MAG: mechanosensitive ion channel family protein [Nitrososphaerota archaeon]|jgi:small-conductance mechanosensitive channel|nr:mechanosensitive ion channel family protein [Nitrososphaerota archaeon]
MSLNESAIDTAPTAFANLSSAFQQMLNISSTSAEILVSILIFSVISLIGWCSYVIISKYVTSWTKKTTTTFDDELLPTIKTVMVVFIGILIIQFSLSPLSFLTSYTLVLDSLFLIVQVILAAYVASKIVNVTIDRFADRVTQKSGKTNKHTIFILKKVVSIIAFVIAAMIIIFLFGPAGVWKSIVASTTISGIIIAFALQSTLSDLFSAFYIYIDRPFEIGDYIVVGEHSGTVKNIGVLTTRLQLLQGEELVISNKELNSTYIRNFRKLQKRRITFKIGVTYDTPNEKLKKIPPMIVEIIKNVKGATPQYVNFNEFGEYSLNFFISFFVNSSEYGKYLEIQQEINLAIRDALDQEGIAMAYLKNVAFPKR